MKKYIFTMLCILVAAATKAQDVMVIEKNDNTTAKFSVDDIRRVYFENSGGPVTPPTSSSQLTCRLKDQDGNPVLLAGIRSSSNDEWLYQYNYDENGNLVSVIGRKETYHVNGLNITGQKIGSDDITNYDIQLELNEAGLISEVSGTIKEYYRATGNLKSTESTTCSYSYDSDNQLI